MEVKLRYFIEMHKADTLSGQSDFCPDGHTPPFRGVRPKVSALGKEGEQGDLFEGNRQLITHRRRRAMDPRERASALRQVEALIKFFRARAERREGQK